ncbi:Aste57867_11232 [Aphanomyces stellatus]|uniref:Aste57867_11232 protein n=1 Tax=Aphanomyces stellatus TaxID=120398 RepID=A0A485KSI7_9STRA|nr:hypothetical protein As57867_011190 [Aphanomyces stellatus]VFT88098.1 Aste57867_11232 [Aphanomyces stellatus]
MCSYLLLRDLSIDVVKGLVSPSDRTSARYSIEIVNRVSHAHVCMEKTDQDFARLLDDLLVALQPGHACGASCPWFHTDIQQKMPKKSFFFGATHKRVVSDHMKLYHDLLNTTSLFCLHPDSRACPNATQAVPKILFQFLFGLDEDLITSSSMSSHESIDTKIDSPLFVTRDDSSMGLMHRDSVAGRRRESTVASCCKVCNRLLEASFDSSLTTLPCGHVFHDDCILEALNQCFECPSCVPRD